MAPPPNDDFANATTITATDGYVDGTTVDATNDEADAAPITGQPNVWYEWTAPVSGSTRFDTGDDPASGTPSDDTYIVVYLNGATLGDLDTVINWNDDGGPGFAGRSKVTFNAEAGITYAIEVGTTDSLAFRLTWALLTSSDPVGVGIAFNDSTLEADVAWTRMSDYANIQSWSINRGRQSELDKTGTGTATVTFVDTEGNLDPTNSSSPLNGLIKPLLQCGIGLQNPITGEWATVFRGFISEWLFDMDQSANVLNVTLELMDAFGLFSAIEMIPGQHGAGTAPTKSANDIFFEGEPDTEKHVNGRQEDALDAAAWSSDLRDIFSGNVTNRKKVYERKDALLTVLQDAADSEFPGVSNIYISKDGIYRFRGRFARFNPSNPDYGINSWSVGGHPQAHADSSVVPFSNVSFRMSELDIINACYATWDDASEAVIDDLLVKDDTSITEFGWHPVAFEGLLTYQGHDDEGETTSTPTEMGKIADYYVSNYANERTRITQLQFRPRGVGSPNATALWDLLTGIEIGDVVTVVSTHPGGGGFGEDYFVEGIQYDADTSGGATFTNVTLSLDVSPAAYYTENPFGDVDGSIPTVFLGGGAGSLTVTGA